MTDDSDTLSSITTENRIKSLELELSQTKDQLYSLQQSNDNLRRSSISLLSENEQAQESISNKLLRQIDQLKRDREQVCQQVEQEEEFMMAAMQRRLEELQREKVAMENALEQEQEFIVNRLQKQLDEYKKNTIIIANNGSSNNNNGNNSNNNGNGNPTGHSNSNENESTGTVITNNGGGSGSETDFNIISNSHHSSPLIKNGNINSPFSNNNNNNNNGNNGNNNNCSSTSAFNRERERELQRIVKSLQEENQQLLFANLNLAQKLRRYTTLESSPIITSTLPSSPSHNLHYQSNNLSHKSGSISDLRHHLSFPGQGSGSSRHFSDSETSK